MECGVDRKGGETTHVEVEGRREEGGREESVCCDG